MNNTSIVVYTTAVNTLLRVVSTMVLTRILAPEDFALVGVVTTVIVIIELLSDAGFRSYLLQHKEGDEPRLLNTIWTLKVIRGFILTAVTFLIAGPMEVFFDIDGFREALMIISPLFIFSGFTNLAQFIEDRHNRPAKPLLIEFFCGVFTTTLTIASTAIFKTVWCIIIGQVIGAFMVMAVFYFYFPQHKVKFHITKDVLPDFFNWSKYIIPSSILTIFIMQADKFVLNKTLPLDRFGLYFIALNLASVGTNTIVNYARRVLAPLLAKTYREAPDTIKASFYSAKHQLALLAAIGLGFGVGVSDTIIDIIYDDRYGEVSTILKILLLNPMLCIISYSAESLVIGMGHVRVTLKANILRVFWIICFVYPAIKFLGVTGVLILFATMELPAALYFIYVGARLKVVTVYKELMYPVLFVGVAWVTTYLHDYLVSSLR